MTAAFSRTAAQAQDSLADQMLRVIALAILTGQYDAADWITAHFFSADARRPTETPWTPGKCADGYCAGQPACPRGTCER